MTSLTLLGSHLANRERSLHAFGALHPEIGTAGYPPGAEKE